jgi:hypothetical protein
MPSTISPDHLHHEVYEVIGQTPIFDLHTHIYDVPFGGLLLWGIDELLTYHYLVAEVFRVAPMPYDQFWAMPKNQQADHVWKHLFLERSPVSEACRGVLTTLQGFGLDVGSRNLDSFREFFRSTTVEAHIDRVFRAAGVKEVVMTNDPFDPLERPVWEKGFERDPRFHAALRMDPILASWEAASQTLGGWGYQAAASLGREDRKEVRRFLEDWIARMNPLYMAVSLTPDFCYPDDSARTSLIEECILPVAREHNMPFALMIGVKRQVNPQLKLAGDSVGKSDVGTVERLCERFPKNKFLSTFLSRENQHELCVTARKFPNLMIFGCWWFMNNPSIIDEMTRERIELLGLSMIPQHSDARVLDQLVYKWRHSKVLIGRVLVEKYADLLSTGWQVTREEIARDAGLLLAGNFERFLSLVL